MIPRILLFGLLILAAACRDVTPAIRNPVMHDITLVTTTFIDDYDSYGIKKSYSRNDTAHSALIIDLGSSGARFQQSGPCGVVDGRVSVGSQSVSGDFDVDEGGPRFTMSGAVNPSGAMVGSWDCQTQTRTPHYYTYKGSFTLRRRP